MNKAIQAIIQKKEILEEKLDNMQFIQEPNKFQISRMVEIKNTIAELNNAIKILEVNNVQS